MLIRIEDDTREILGVQDPLDEEERLCNLIGFFRTDTQIKGVHALFFIANLL
ncbi:hypothetical protein [uncultured Methanolobus sp.]|uniref:hypothetical protein n=1 Tax=uncultured Methanolobus sp. TaxID=218300 RepID=UPI00374A94DA